MIPLRASGPEDVPDLVRLESRAGREPWSAARLTGVLDHPCGEGWLLRRTDSPPLAHLLALVVADEAEILTIAVDPDHQRQGHGRGLLGQVLTAWWRRGVQRVVLEVRVDNRAARALYTRSGFTRVGLRPDYYADGTDALVLGLERPAALSG